MGLLFWCVSMIMISGCFLAIWICPWWTVVFVWDVFTATNESFSSVSNFAFGRYTIRDQVFSYVTISLKRYSVRILVRMPSKSPANAWSEACSTELTKCRARFMCPDALLAQLIGELSSLGLLCNNITFPFTERATLYQHAKIYSISLETLINYISREHYYKPFSSGKHFNHCRSNGLLWS